MGERFFVQAFKDGLWKSLSDHPTIVRAIAEIDFRGQRDGGHTPLRVWDDDANLRVAQNPAAEAKRIRDDSEERKLLIAKEQVAAARVRVAETKPFHIVMSLDKPGPCERDGQQYRRHKTANDAKDEARRLSAECKGGRFAVLALTWVTGWSETDIPVDDGIPF